ncbi:MAG: hypothetical protein ACI4QA_00775 [Candidatus Spyradosoma sp.]
MKRYVFAFASIFAFSCASLCVGQETPPPAQKTKVGWLDGENTNRVGENEENKIQALAVFKKKSFWKILPPDIKQAVENNIANSYFDKGAKKDGIFVRNNVSVDKIQGSYAVQVLRWDLMQFLDAPEQSSPLNPQTGKYYVVPASATLKGLNESDLDYVKKLTERVNRNIHYLGHSPIPKIDLNKMNKGAYVTISVLPLRLLAEVYLSPNSPIVKVNKTTLAEIRQFFGLEDTVDFELAKRFGVPVYHPERFQPTAHIRPDRSCRGLPRPMEGFAHLALPISLGWSLFITHPEDAYNLFYTKYFGDAQRAVKVFKKGLAAEAALHVGDSKAAAVESIIKQAEPYVTEIEKKVDKCIEQADTIYKTPPRSILEPSGKTLTAFLAKQKAQQKAQQGH